ncbi:MULTISPECIES: SDR family oxidoreductase [unclassified Mycobacterium]|uniref:SDR family oxidoreductase n=1 Tax=Mycobacterium sp. DL99 TaxID=2528957 RepID=UPI001081F970|nr:SDR family oxidoreductase [Mycobacterium sp. DL99]
MHISLEDRTYLVTGGGSGIGKGAAAAIVAAGGNALLIGRNADKLSAAAEELGAQGPGSVRYEPADVTDEDEVRRAVDAATAWNGQLHGVVHSAGGSLTIGPITQIDSELWRQTVDLNVNGTMYLIKHAGREMVRAGGGSFVGISSIASTNTHRWFGAYGVSKAAFDHLLKLAADELGPSSVRFNSIRPGLTRTEMVGPVFELPEARDDYKACTPMPRFGEVEDIANLAVFLLSDAAGWITGQSIGVDGGHSLRRGPDISGMLEPLYGVDGLRGVVAE